MWTAWQAEQSITTSSRSTALVANNQITLLLTVSLTDNVTGWQFRLILPTSVAITSTTQQHATFTDYVNITDIDSAQAEGNISDLLLVNVKDPFYKISN